MASILISLSHFSLFTCELPLNFEVSQKLPQLAKLGGAFSSNSAAEDNMTEVLRSMIKPNTILVLSKTSCPYCTAAKDLLRALNVKNLEVVELNLRQDGSKLQDAAQQISNQRTVPNIWIGTRHIGGNSDLQALNKSGELSKILKAEGVA